jgi:hypothetical protein
VTLFASNASFGSLPATVARPPTDTAFQAVPASVSGTGSGDGLPAPPEEHAVTSSRSKASESADGIFMTAEAGGSTERFRSTADRFVNAAVGR